MSSYLKEFSGLPSKRVALTRSQAHALAGLRAPLPSHPRPTRSCRAEADLGPSGSSFCSVTPWVNLSDQFEP